MANLPFSIGDEEKLVRVIKKHHLHKGKRLTYHAFIPTYNASAISVIRQLVGDDVCKDTAVQQFLIDYRGLAVVVSGAMRQLELDVYPEEGPYDGHAHIDFGFPRPPKSARPDEPLRSLEKSRMIEKCKNILSCSVYYADNDPGQPGWHGPSLA